MDRIFSAFSAELRRLAELEKRAQSPESGLRPGVTLFPHQKDAVAKIMKQDGNLLLSHPVGSGKTITSIAAYETLRSAGKATNALVVVPASLRNNYLDNGVNKFTTAQGRIFGNAAEVSAGTHESTTNADPNARYHIVSYEMFRKNPKEYIDAAKADTIIYDEIHKAKNEGVKTTDAIRGARQYHRNFIGMTGSIVSNTPSDLVPLVDAMTNGKHVLGKKVTFESRFVNIDDKGNRQLKNPQVARTLLAPYIHHVDASEMGNRAPKKEIDEVRVEMSPHQSKLYRFVTDKLDPISKLALKAGTSKLNNAELNGIFSKLIRLRQVSNSIGTMDHGISLAESAEQTPKIKKVLDDVQEHLRDTKDGQAVLHTNLIVGGVDVLTAGLKARGIDHALFIGKGQPGVTEKTRQKGVKEYQAGQKRVIVLSAAGGEGLDLPNTTFMGMVDGHFNPEKINQAEARGIRSGGLSHRMEQDRKVMVRRYVSVLPAKDMARVAEVGKNIWDLFNPAAMQKRVEAGGTAFFNPFKQEKTTDQWVYDVAARKGGLNTALHGVIKKASAPIVYETHEQFEESIKQAALSGRAIQALGGAAVGGLMGLAIGGTEPRTKVQKERDPNAVTRNRVSAVLGGAITGALIGGLSRPDPSMLAPAFGGTMGGAIAGKSIGNLMAPVANIPESVLKVVGEGQQEYSDRKIFQKYWDEFGSKLEAEGHEANLDPIKEQRFIDALRDTYTEVAATKSTGIFADKPQDLSVRYGGTKSAPPSKGKFVANALASTVYPTLSSGVFSSMMGHLGGESMTPGSMLRGAAIGGLPTTAAILAGAANNYRKLYIDPGLSAKSKSEARVRREFDDENLRKLLRGLSVDEVKVKSHVLG